jgi:hypothetical protein
VRTELAAGLKAVLLSTRKYGATKGLNVRNPSGKELEFHLKS